MRMPENFDPAPEPDAETGIDRQVEVLKFRDYWTAKSGKDATKLDWQATWRNWARNAKRQPALVGKREPANKQTALEQRNRAVADQWLRDQETQNAPH